MLQQKTLHITPDISNQSLKTNPSTYLNHHILNMPSIEISLSSDSLFMMGSHSNESDRKTMALYEEHAVTEDNLVSLAANHHLSLSHHGNCSKYNGHHYHDVIEIHDEMEDNELDDDDSGIFESRKIPTKQSSDDVVNRFRSMIQYNFASRANMSPLDDTARRRSPVVALTFVEHRL